MGFCDYLKEIEMACNKCVENGVGACTVKLGEQKYYTGFGLCDTVSIIRHDHNLSIETDIEVRYKTDYPYGRFSGKAAEFAEETAGKDKKIRDFLGPKLPRGARFLTTHQHYNPDNFDPNYVAMHIHAHKSANDLDEAKIIASQMVEAIKKEEIESVLKG